MKFSENALKYYIKKKTVRFLEFPKPNTLTDSIHTPK